jgi:hypothetical protein
MSDPASLKASVIISGMTLNEAAVAFANLQGGSEADVQVTQPALGGKRYAIGARGLSIQGARDLTTAVFLHCEQVANGGTDG